MIALRWRDVDFVGGMLHVRKNFTGGVEKVPKGKKVRSVPMTPEVLDALGRMKEREDFTGDEDLVFCSLTAVEEGGLAGSAPAVEAWSALFASGCQLPPILSGSRMRSGASPGADSGDGSTYGMTGLIRPFLQVAHWPNLAYLWAGAQNHSRGDPRRHAPDALSGDGYQPDP
jgi:hypothetical protein